MNNTELVHECIDHAEAWLSDGYVGEIRCIQYVTENGTFIQSASLTFTPSWTSVQIENNLELEASGLVADQIALVGLSKDELTSLVRNACNGQIMFRNFSASLPRPERDFDCYSEALYRDRWVFPLKFTIFGDRLAGFSALRAMQLDDALRQASPPFDGLDDLTNWLDLKASRDGASPTGIVVTVAPPLELLFNEHGMESEWLKVKIRLTAGADKRKVGITLRTVPSTVAAGRKELTHQIRWTKKEDGSYIGEVASETGKAVGSQILLTYFGRTVARQWFWDLAKSPSARYHAMAQFDPELKGLRNALFTGTDSREFEKAVGCVAYLTGLSAALPLQTKTPDIVASTPRGRQLVIECAVAISDFSTKLGKLVDRCNALKKGLTEAHITTEVIGVLVCRLPMDQIAKNDAELKKHRILLVTGEALESALRDAWRINDVDQIIDKKLAQWSSENPFS